jgi:hypothetical protein
VPDDRLDGLRLAGGRRWVDGRPGWRSHARVLASADRVPAKAARPHYNSLPWDDRVPTVRAARWQPPVSRRPGSRWDVSKYG